MGLPMRLQCFAAGACQLQAAMIKFHVHSLFLLCVRTYSNSLLCRREPAKQFFPRITSRFTLGVCVFATCIATRKMELWLWLSLSLRLRVLLRPRLWLTTCVLCNYAREWQNQAARCCFAAFNFQGYSWTSQKSPRNSRGCNQRLPHMSSSWLPWLRLHFLQHPKEFEYQSYYGCGWRVDPQSSVHLWTSGHSRPLRRQTDRRIFVMKMKQ